MTIDTPKSGEPFPQKASATETHEQLQHPEISEISDEQLASMTPENFLAISKDVRISCITEPRIKTSELLEGKVDSLTIDFRYGGILNSELQKKVTAGQVLSDRIMTVQKDGVSYTRRGIEGEFFNENNKRLTILQGETLHIPSATAMPAYTEQLETYDRVYEDFVQQAPEYADEKYQNLIVEMLKRDIEPKFGLLLLQARIADFASRTDFDDPQVEAILIDLGRSFNGVELKRTDEKYSLSSAVQISHYLFPATFEEMLSEYGYTKEEIEKSLDKNPDPISYKVDSPDNYYAPAEYTSHGVEYTDSGTTACARTAFKNLKRFGVDVQDTNVLETDDLHHAHVLLKKYQKQGKIQSFPPSGDYEFADLFLDASQAKYKHRVACYRSKTDGQWYVLDPYYRIDLKNRDRNDPMPWLQYKKYMDGRGQKFHGAVMY